MGQSIFYNLFKYRQTDKMSPTENYLTEILAWMVDTLPQFGRDYVRFLCSKSKENILQGRDIFKTQCKSQVNIEKDGVIGQIDMVISTDRGVGFICEHKVDSSLGVDQLEKYKKCKDKVDEECSFNEAGSTKYQIVLVTKNVIPKEENHNPDIALNWRDIYLYYSERLNAYDTVERMMIEQFLLYLTEKGMGMMNAISIQDLSKYPESKDSLNNLKIMFGDLAENVDWKNECKGIEQFVSEYEVGCNKNSWRRVDVHFSKEWTPYLWAGVFYDLVYSNREYKLPLYKDKDEPVFAVVIEYDPDGKTQYQASVWLQALGHDMEKIKSEYGFEVVTKPDNKYFALVIGKPLSKVLEGVDEDYNKQKERIKEEMVRGINLILKYYQHRNSVSTSFFSEETIRYYEDRWIEHQLPALSKKRYWFLDNPAFGKCRKEFWRIISCDDWKNINFHFELRWNGWISMTKAPKLNIRIHLESEMPREYFRERGCTFGGANASNTIQEVNGAKLDASVIPDFSNEEKAKDTILKIFEVLDSPAYQQCAEIANAYLQQMKNGK